jgi:hypothetical protein
VIFLPTGLPKHRIHQDFSHQPLGHQPAVHRVAWRLFIWWYKNAEALEPEAMKQVKQEDTKGSKLNG